MSANSVSEFEIDHEWVTNAATGGAVLGGGGGGSLDEGLDFSQLAVNYGKPCVQPLETIADDAYVLTVSAVGAPAATDRYVKPQDYVRAVELVRDRLADRDEHVAALMTNEMGGFATVNGLLQSAVTGLPEIGRAHV